jgi:hypothetical protein
LGGYTRFERLGSHARPEAEEIAMAGRPKKKLAVTRSRKSVDATEQDFIDRIYECAFLPELWPGVLDELARIANARGGFLFVANKEVVNWTTSESLRLGMEAFVAGPRGFSSSAPASPAKFWRW